MAKPYSKDLRERVLAAVDAGESIAGVARRFSVSRPTIHSWLRLRKDTGALQPREREPSGRVLDKHRKRIEQRLQEKPGLTLKELQTKLKLPVSVSTVCRALQAWKLTYKKKSVCV